MLVCVPCLSPGIGGTPDPTTMGAGDAGDRVWRELGSGEPGDGMSGVAMGQGARAGDWDPGGMLGSREWGTRALGDSRGWGARMEWDAAGWATKAGNGDAREGVARGWDVVG